MQISRKQLQALLACCGPHAASEAAADVLQRLADSGLGVVPLRTWSRGLFSKAEVDTDETAAIVASIVNRLNAATARVAHDNRLPLDAALDWECLAASVRLLASLDARDHEARLNLRRNKQELLEEVSHGFYTVNFPQFVRCYECCIAKQAQCGAAGSSALCRRRHLLMPGRAAAHNMAASQTGPGGHEDARSNIYDPSTWKESTSSGKHLSRTGSTRDGRAKWHGKVSVVSDTQAFLNQLQSRQQGPAAKDWRLMDARQRLQEVNAGVDMLLDRSRRPQRDFFARNKQQPLRAPAAGAGGGRKRLSLLASAAMAVAKSQPMCGAQQCGNGVKRKTAADDSCDPTYKPSTVAAVQKPRLHLRAKKPRPGPAASDDDEEWLPPGAAAAVPAAPGAIRPTAAAPASTAVPLGPAHRFQQPPSPPPGGGSAAACSAGVRVAGVRLPGTGVPAPPPLLQQPQHAKQPRSRVAKGEAKPTHRIQHLLPKQESLPLPHGLQNESPNIPVEFIPVALHGRVPDQESSTADGDKHSWQAPTAPKTPPPTPDRAFRRPLVAHRPNSSCGAHPPLQEAPPAEATAPGAWLAVLGDPAVNISGWVPQQPTAFVDYGMPALQSATDAPAPCCGSPAEQPQHAFAVGPSSTVAELRADWVAEGAVCGARHAQGTAMGCSLFCSKQLLGSGCQPAADPEAARRISDNSCQEVWHQGPPPLQAQAQVHAAPPLTLQHAALRPSALLRHSTLLPGPPQPLMPLVQQPAPQRRSSPDLYHELFARYINDGPESQPSSCGACGSEDTTAARM